MPESESTAAETSFAKDLWNQAERMLDRHGRMVPPYQEADDFIRDTPNMRVGSAENYVYVFVSGVYLAPADSPNPVLRYIAIMGSLQPESDLEDLLALEKNFGGGLADKPFTNIPDMEKMSQAAQVLNTLEQRYR